MEIDKLALISIKGRKLLSVMAEGRDVFYVPGGKREKGESDEQALTREVKEELSVDVIPETIRYYGTFVAQAHGKEEGTKVRATCYTADFKGTPRPSSEIIRIAWLSSNDADKVPPLGKLILEDLKKKGLVE